LRLALASAPSIPVEDTGGSRIDTILDVPTRFQVPVKGRLIGEQAEGWKWKRSEVGFNLKPGEPLQIPLQAEVPQGAFVHTPAMTIEFEPGRFRNRTIKFYPLKLAGPTEILVQHSAKAPVIDGNLGEWSGTKP